MLRNFTIMLYILAASENRLKAIFLVIPEYFKFPKATSRGPLI